MLRKIFILSVILLLGLASKASAKIVTDVYSDDVKKDGRYVYAYPDTSSITEVDYEKHSGPCSLKIILDPTTYSGVAIGNYPTVDLADVRKTGKLEFWVKGKEGGEMFQITLIDSDNMDGTKTELRIPVVRFAKVTTSWQKVSIPLSALPDTGVYWDGTREVKSEFDWYDFVEIKFNIPPLRGKDSFTIFVDDIKMVE